MRKLPHPFAHQLAREHRSGRISRREFLSRATALGVSPVLAYGLIGQRPAHAQRATEPAVLPESGQGVRIQMDVLPLPDPRIYEWSETGNVSRGVLEYLVEYRFDGSFHGVLLEAWEANEDATIYRLFLRDGVQWNTGAPFSAEDVAANFDGWADASVPGNSMAVRLAALVDPATGRAREGGIRIIDPLTVEIHLSRPDVTLIPSLSDYPAAVQHRDKIGTSILDHGVGTGAYRITDFETGGRAILERNLEHRPWRPAFMDWVAFLDLGPDPYAWQAAAADGMIDMTYSSNVLNMDGMEALGWQRSEVETAATAVIRGNQLAEIGGRRPYADPRVRRALALSVDNAICLELGIGGFGDVADNYHVCPIQPDYAQISPAVADPKQAHALMEAAGMLDYQHELVSVDDTWQRRTADAVAAQMRDAGLRVERSIVPRSEFNKNWNSYPFSTTNWNHRELGVQVLSLAYRSGVAWNETGFNNPEFDALLDQASIIADNTARQATMAELEQILQSEGVIIQPYWQSLFRHMRVGLLNAHMHPKYEIDVHKLAWAEI